MHDQNLTKTFYQFLGLHSLLIGIFPFFIPVYLWKQGFELGAISLFIGAGGLGFCIGLWVWDHIRHRVSLTSLIGLSLILEVLLLINVRVLGMNLSIMLLLGLSYGVYNSFFWTTQRALFFERVDTSNSGRRYGNLQIYVGLLLQVGIFIGAILLEKSGFDYILLVSTLLCIGGFFLFALQRTEVPTALNAFKPLSLSEIFKFRDKDTSKLIFIVDGIYLFLESFFWVISLFLLAHESFTRLGIMVMSLAIIFGILFYLLKNSIDRLGRKQVYRLGVVLYAISWILRATMDNDLSLFVMFIALIIITFCTSFFRLTMNKRFYDLARETLSHRYLILKSYYSQITIAVVYLGFGFILLENPDSAALLKPIYWVAGAGSLVFLFYGATRYDRNSHSEQNTANENQKI